jgi:hypothetical protein
MEQRMSGFEVPDIPRWLYKYFSLNIEQKPERLEWIRKILVEGMIYFPAASSFNDPFDCRPIYDTNGTTEDQWRDYFNEVLQRHEPHLTSSQRREKVENFLNEIRKGDQSVVRQGAQQDFETRMNDNIYNRTGILCLSDKYDNLLMWSHYADSHKGICIQFDMNKARNYFLRILNVDYSDLYPVINPAVDNESIMYTKALLTKSTAWQYEDEWRMTAYKEGPNYFQVPAGMITSILLGAYIGIKKQQLLKWINQMPVKPYVYEAVYATRKFALEFKAVPLPGMNNPPPFVETFSREEKAK